MVGSRRKEAHSYAAHPNAECPVQGGALHEPPHLVAADVRRLTLSQRVLREKDQSLVTSAATLDWIALAQGFSQGLQLLPFGQIEEGCLMLVGTKAAQGTTLVYAQRLLHGFGA